MNLRLEELRRRLLEPGALPANGKTVYQRSSLPTYQRRESGQVVEVEIADNPPLIDGPADYVPEPFNEPVAAAVPESVTAAVLQYVQQNAGEQPPESINVQDAGQYQLAQAVAKVFDQTRAFEESLSGIRNMLDPMKQAGSSLAQSIEPLKALEAQIQELAQAFTSMRTFQSQLTQLAESFEPMRCLEQQVVQFSESFGLHLNRLNRTLDMARVFKNELVNLAQSLEPIDDMRGRFDLLISGYATNANGGLQS
jgi:hypothetical protein